MIRTLMLLLLGLCFVAASNANAADPFNVDLS